VTRRLTAAHEAAVPALKSRRGDPRVGICLQLPAFEPARPGDLACEALQTELREEMYDAYLDRPSGDWIGVQYYTRSRVDPAASDWEAPAPAGARLTQMGWEWHPEGLLEALRAAARPGLPLYVTENGIATADDAERIEYLAVHLEQVKRALAEGVDLRGYFYWSSFDNFEWAEGYRPTFGLIGVDRADGLRRVVRPSAEAFGRVAREGRIAALSA
jgi:beta-glucosidase